jgi:hypothetical protein
MWIIVMLAVLIVAYITIINGYPAQDDDEPKFTLREIMQVMMNKRCPHSNIISNATATQSLSHLNKKA